MKYACSIRRLSENPLEVVFSTSKIVFSEGLVDAMWVGRYWSADCRPKAPSDAWCEPAFDLEIDGTRIPSGWFLGRTPDRIAQQGDLTHHLVRVVAEKPRVEVGIHTVLDGTPIVRRWLDVRNASERALAITGILPWAMRIWAHKSYRDHPPKGPDRPFALGYFTRDDWSYEGWFGWKELEPGSTIVRCDKGQGFNDPFFILLNRATGEHWICHLAWSANWVMDFQRDEGPGRSCESLRFGIGPHATDPQRVILPGETVGSPSVHLGCVSGDLDTAVQAMHEHIRGSVLPKMRSDRSFRIQYSVPGDQGYPLGSPGGLDERTLLDNVDLAAALGAEVFIVDAGWWDVAGDWTPSRSRLPRGLEPVIERARSKGLLFGLYAEIEGGRGNWTESRIHQEHPDWFGPKNILDLGRREVAEYVEGELTRLIETYHLDLFRLDYNPLFTLEGPSTERWGYDENNYWRYYEAFYSMFDRIHRRYPDLILQQAAAGGARNDLGTSGRFHETYLTDGLRVPHVLQVYSGQTLALPPEAFVIGLGADGGSSKGRPMNLDTNLRTIFTLSTPWVFAGMVAPSLKELSLKSRERFLHYAAIYKRFIRPLLPYCRVFHHSPVSSRGGVESSPWFAMEYASTNRDKAWAILVRMGPSPDDEYVLRPRGLDRGRSYTTILDGTGETIMVDGMRLAQSGLAIRLEEVGASELILFESR